MVKWSKMFDHDHAQNFKIAVVKWSKSAIFDHDHRQNFKIAVVKWSKSVILTIEHGQNRGCHGHGQCLTPPYLLFCIHYHSTNSGFSNLVNKYPIIIAISFQLDS